MKLIGMMDSPYVRRVAISFDYLGIEFEHKAVSVFSTFEEFKRINPVVKAPTLICDDGTLIMDSTLIIQFLETSRNNHSLWPSDPECLQHDFRVLSLALAACEKSVQIVYEQNLRPVSARHEPWLVRIRSQLLSACEAWEMEIESGAYTPKIIRHATISSAVVWQFIQSTLSSIVPPAGYPNLNELSKRLEQEDVFLKYPPVGPGV